MCAQQGGRRRPTSPARGPRRASAQRGRLGGLGKATRAARRRRLARRARLRLARRRRPGGGLGEQDGGQLRRAVLRPAEAAPSALRVGGGEREGALLARHAASQAGPVEAAAGEVSLRHEGELARVVGVHALAARRPQHGYLHGGGPLDAEVRHVGRRAHEGALVDVSRRHHHLDRLAPPRRPHAGAISVRRRGVAAHPTRRLLRRRRAGVAGHMRGVDGRPAEEQLETHLAEAEARSRRGREEAQGWGLP